MFSNIVESTLVLYKEILAQCVEANLFEFVKLSVDLEYSRGESENLKKYKDVVLSNRDRFRRLALGHSDFFTCLNWYIWEVDDSIPLPLPKPSPMEVILAELPKESYLRSDGTLHCWRQCFL